jgi:transcriptional regulator with XRE-family HTH domain
MTKSQSHAKWFLAPYCIGMKLRTLRTEKRLTLARLKAETGLSTALLSKLETDRMVPTLPTLATICRVYGVGLGYFFSEPTEHCLAITRKLTDQGRGRTPDQGGRIPLNASVPDRRLDASLVDLAPGLSAADSRPNANDALLVYVLDGRLNLDMGGARETLESGDCAYLESDLPMNWGAAGKQPCRLLTVIPANPGLGTGGNRSDSQPLQTP